MAEKRARDPNTGHFLPGNTYGTRTALPEDVRLVQSLTKSEVRLRVSKWLRTTPRELVEISKKLEDNDELCSADVAIIKQVQNSYRGDSKAFDLLLSWIVGSKVADDDELGREQRRQVNELLESIPLEKLTEIARNKVMRRRGDERVMAKHIRDEDVVDVDFDNG